MKLRSTWKGLLAIPLCATLLMTDFDKGKAADAELYEENIIINNNPGTSDFITVAGIKSGDQLYVYDHPSMYTPIEVKKATSSVLHFTSKKLKDEQQTLYFVLKRGGEQVGTYKSVSYDTPGTNHIGQSGYHLVNRAGFNDYLKIHDARKGFSYKIYDSQDLNREIASATASKDGYLSIKMTLPKYENDFEKKSVYLTSRAPGNGESKAQQILITPEHSNPINAKTVTVKNNKNYADTINLNPATIGSTIKVYRTKKETTYVTPATEKYEPTVIASRVAKGNQVTVYFPQLGTNAGYVYVTITESGELESDPVKIKFGKEK